MPNFTELTKHGCTGVKTTQWPLDFTFPWDLWNSPAGHRGKQSRIETPVAITCSRKLPIAPLVTGPTRKTGCGDFTQILLTGTSRCLGNPCDQEWDPPFTVSCQITRFGIG